MTNQLDCKFLEGKKKKTATSPFWNISAYEGICVSKCWIFMTKAEKYLCVLLLNYCEQ